MDDGEEGAEAGNVQDSAAAPKVCPHCGKIFPAGGSSSTRYHKHIKLHKNLRPYRCSHPGCGKTFKRATHLTRHLAGHLTEKPHVCQVDGCGKSFSTSDRLKRHQKVHEKLSCDVCGRCFKKRKQLELHKSKGHAEVTCSLCSEVFENSKSLAKHMRTHQDRYKCSDCEKAFPRYSDLQKHQKAEHRQVHLCAECGKAYCKAEDLEKHRLRVHEGMGSSSVGSHLCQHPGCGQSFSSAWNLKMHEQARHQALRNFKCPICDESFAFKHVLTRHRKLIHGGKVSPPRASASARDDESLNIATVSCISASSTSASSAGPASLAGREVVPSRVPSRSLSSAPVASSEPVASLMGDEYTCRPCRPCRPFSSRSSSSSELLCRPSSAGDESAAEQIRKSSATCRSSDQALFAPRLLRKRMGISREKISRKRLGKTPNSCQKGNNAIAPVQKRHLNPQPAKSARRRLIGAASRWLEAGNAAAVATQGWLG